MLDDLKYLHTKDQQDTLGLAGKQWKQLEHVFELERGHEFAPIENVVFGGMGGSALAALIVHNWPGLTVPFEIVRDYTVPAYVNKKTLFIASSYSGNTEETLNALEDAASRGAQIAVIAGGGKLQKIAAENKYTYADIPKVTQPRYGVFYSLRATLTILEKAGLLDAKVVNAELEEVAKLLAEAAKEWAPDVPTSSNSAKRLARELMGKSIVVYGGPKMFPAAYKWKISFNENSKQVAWCGQISEFNHNEMIGWSKQPVDKPYAVIDVRSNLEHERIQKRFVVGARLLSGLRPEPFIVQAEGKTELQQVLWAIMYGDFVSLYLAFLNGLDPAPIDLVESFKKALND